MRRGRRATGPWRATKSALGNIHGGGRTRLTARLSFVDFLSDSGGGVGPSRHAATRGEKAVREKGAGWRDTDRNARGTSKVSGSTARRMKTRAGHPTGQRGQAADGVSGRCAPSWRPAYPRLLNRDGARVHLTSSTSC